mmetsp:Transcript_15638/g.25940  ORF Transcript_15638/g.25940 Transcript_15638/m.25940 type:complete len:537 (+) Transcript_15638:161-1771(+)|eukprot:CAMPEP_0184658180 /NCGR_PEP_ID=MMETSP0308-20130426/23947_1 /TAXON_ID=38269 /ORGANISM="Gloeochaete witrockiana, Strain SAG 46.84" /LENGTH=536 /DNA_ID=CAMNT_0027096897 /DNA_START=139 /DNA_END=1749 /DNA_ORIENTATION=-
MQSGVKARRGITKLLLQIRHGEGSARRYALLGIIMFGSLVYLMYERDAGQKVQNVEATTKLYPPLGVGKMVPATVEDLVIKRWKRLPTPPPPVTIDAPKKHVCFSDTEGSSLDIVCPDGFVIDQIVFAQYGDADHLDLSKCSEVSDHPLKCGRSVKALLEQECLNKIDCIFHVHPMSLGDPGCAEIKRKLVAKAICRPDAVASMQNWQEVRPVFRPAGCVGGPAYCEDFKNAFRVTHRSQQPDDCRSTKWFVYDEEDTSIGRSLALKSAALAFAVEQGRVLFSRPGQWRWGNGAWCEMKGMACFFVPDTKCIQEELQRSVQDRDKRPIIDWETARFNQDGHDVVQIPSTPEDVHLSMVPAKWKWEKKYGPVWWRHISISYLMQPNEKLRGEIEKTKKELSLPHPYISIHVQIEGDPQKRSKDLAAYVETAQQFSITNFFLSTTDPHVIEDTKKFPKYTWYLGKVCQSSPTGDPEADTACALNQITNVILASEGDHIIGSLSSDLGMLINALAKTDGKGGKTYVDIHGDHHTTILAK